MLQTFYQWTPVLSKMPLFPHCINSRIKKSRFFELINFWHEHHGEFEFSSDGYAFLKELKLASKIEESLRYFGNYYDAQKNYRFYSENGQVYMQIAGFTFQLCFLHGIPQLIDLFHDDAYGFYNIEDKLVVDVGAFIGDSAIYFSSKGAREVVAYEPNPELFEIAESNMKRNNMSDKIQLIQKAVSSNVGKCDFRLNQYNPGESSTHLDCGWTTTFQVDTVSLSSITQELGHVDLMKIDYEGAEYDILSSAYSERALNHIDKLLVEIHGSPEVIIDILRKADFSIDKFEEIPFSFPLFFLFASKKQN